MDTQIHAEYCHLITRVFICAEVLVAELKPTFRLSTRRQRICVIFFRDQDTDERGAADGDAVANQGLRHRINARA